MAESRDNNHSGGLAHSSAKSRRRSSAEEQRYNKLMTSEKLELYAGTQYVRITNESELSNALQSCSGASMGHRGAPSFDVRALPPNTLNTPITGEPKTGGRHPLGPEYMFNAKRNQALSAFLVDTEGRPIDVHDTLKSSMNYFDDAGNFQMPELHKGTAELPGKNGFFICIDPNVNNIFDTPLPRPVFGVVKAGDALRELYHQEKMAGADQGRSLRFTVADHFFSFMTGVDKEHLAMEIAARESVSGFDAIHMSEDERKQLRHYGEVDTKHNAIVEPQQVLKDYAMQARRVVSQLIEPWNARVMQSIEAKWRLVLQTEEDENGECFGDPMRAGYFEELHDKEGIGEHFATQRKRYCSVLADMAKLHLSRIEAAFKSGAERETIPAGYCAMFDYIKASTEELGTASIAWHFDHNMVAEDTTSFAQIFLWIGQVVEADGKIDGRDRRRARSPACPLACAPSRAPSRMQDHRRGLRWFPLGSRANRLLPVLPGCSPAAPRANRLLPGAQIFFHFFEQYADYTFLLLLCGPKGPPVPLPVP